MARSVREKGPSPWRHGWRRLTRLWQTDAVTGVDDELRFHFEQKVAEFEAAGLSAKDAQARAEEEFGDVNAVRTTLAEIDTRVATQHRRAEWWENAAQDLRFVARSLRRSPIFTVTVVVTLALGLGANAAIFSILDRIYIQPPPGLTDAAHVRRVYQNTTNRGEPYIRVGFSYPEVRAMRAVAPSGMMLASYGAAKVPLGRDANAAEVQSAYVEGDFFAVAGVPMALGRSFTAEESRIEGQSMVAVISHSLWKRVYNGDSSVIGTTVDLGSHRHVIVGVAAEKFRGLEVNATDIWVPMSSAGVLADRKPDWYESRNINGNRVVIREASEAAEPVFAARATTVLRDPTVRVMRDSLSTVGIGSIIEARNGRGLKNELEISTRLAGVALVILLIACANVINLMLARAAQRKREIAVRLALGISRRRLLSQLLLESVVLALLSLTLALFVALVGATTLRGLLLPDVQWSTSIIDGRVVLFTTVLSLVIGFTAGLVPALQASRPDLASALKSSVRDGGQRGSALRSGMLIAQAALSVVLLVGAGVFARSLHTVQSIDTGFDTDRLVFASISYDRELGSRRKEIEQRMPEVADRIRRMPGVEQVALAANIPMYGFSFVELFLPGRDSLPPSGGVDRIVSVITPEYFDAVGLRVLRGRKFDDADREGSEMVLAVNENMARNLWPGEEALGKCIILSTRESTCRRVVAIVAPAHFSRVLEKPSMLYYVPMAQGVGIGSPSALVVRAKSGQTRAVRSTMQRELTDMFGSWARPNVRTMEEIVAPELRPWRVGATLFTAAGLLALLVAAVGIYSSLSYSISQRAREMGVRVALGASASSIMRLVVSSGVRVVAVGVALGVLASLGLASLVSSLLYETSARDPLVLVGAALMLLSMAVISSAIPAWRASRIDPLNAMRAE